MLYSGSGHVIIWRMRITCWIPKATDTRSEYVVPIAFPLENWLHERTTMLRYTYSACLLFFYSRYSDSLWAGRSGDRMAV